MFGSDLTAAQLQLATTAGEAGRAIIDNWKTKRALAEFDQRTRQAYLAALEQAKQTGDMPEQFQVKVPVDELTAQIGLKAVAIRELGKARPAHPMVTSQRCREAVAKATLIKYNRANRPSGPEVALIDYAPTDEQAQQIFDLCAQVESVKPR